ncbi:MAG: efflux RND transporter permease subunit [bacterium]|jgi:multidrug efflux pump subunit AcrB
MLAQFSVKKPYTVFVTAILIIVLGVISFTNMITDLLPAMELPYVVVVTTYPGASPEKVEQMVTRPLEAVLGTSSGLKNISSISSENSSMIVLEYVQDTNMDSVMIELSSSIDTVSAQFEEGVGTPILLKISPDMIPIVVASIDYEGMDIDELSSFTTDTIVPAFERIEGVASVSASGLIEKQLEIVLDKERIEDLNSQVKAEVEKKLDENRQKLEDAQKEIAKGRDALKRESPSKQKEIAKASAELDDAISNLNAMLAEEKLLEAQKQAFEKEKEGLEQLAELNQLFEQLFPMGIADLPPDMYQAIMQQVGDKLPAELSGLSQQEMAELAEKAAEAPARIAAIEVELQNINVRQMTHAAMKPQLESAVKEAKAGLEKLESGKITMAIEMAKAEVMLENSEKELEKGLEEFEKAKEEALESADLNNILTQDLLKNIIAAQNFSMPAGYIIQGNNQHLVKVGDSFGSREEIENMVIFNIDPVGDIRLSDIADIEMTDNASEMYTRVNGNAGIILMFQKQSTASTAEVSEDIGKQIQKLEDQYKGLRIRPMMDQGDYIYMITDSVIENLLYGGILAIIVLIVFLWDVRPMVVIALSIPLSLMFAVTLMYFTDITLNVISLSGLALAVGMLVDNSIVVIENIYRLRQEGLSVIEAAVEGAKEVSGAIIASTLTTVCVFLPIVFTQGLTRQLFADMGLTLGYSLRASLLVALTLVPVLGSKILVKTKEKKHRVFDSILRVYEKMLRFVLRRKAVILIPVLLLFVLSIYGTTIMGTAFMPEVDSPQISATLKLPDDGDRDDLYAMSDEVMKRILEIDAVETVGALSGQQSGMMMMGRGSDDETTFYILLKEQRDLTNRDVERLIYEKTKDLDCEINVNINTMDLSVLGGSGIQIYVKGQNLDTLADISNEIAGILREIEGIGKVETGLEDADKETRIMVDKDKAMREGLTVAQIYAEISGALQTETKATTLTVDNDNYPVLLVKEDQEGITKENIADYTFTVTEKDGTEKEIALKDIAEIKEVDSLRSIRRENQSRYMMVTAEIAGGYNIGLVSRDVEAKLADYEPPEGYEISIEGENEMIRETMRDLLLMIALAVAFIYLIMVAQFENLMSPFIVLFTLPLAFTGGLLLLWAAGLELSVVSLLGFLVLAGVVVNNGIVFVDYVNQLRERGLEKREALVKAGVTRIRPILMTALTTILAMTTLALGFGSGAEMAQPMAVVSIGGLTYATILTLFVVPVMYDIFVRNKKEKVA